MFCQKSAIIAHVVYMMMISFVEEKEDETLSEESSSGILKSWIQIQDSLKTKLVTSDDFAWKIPNNKKDEHCRKVNYVGGVDISYLKQDNNIGCGTLVVLNLETLEIVYEDSRLVNLTIPYIPGFLAFREAPIFLKLLEKMKNNHIRFYPEILMVDGNGLLHPRGFGLACQLGVLADIPTIGIGKSLHRVDGLVEEYSSDDVSILFGDSGQTLGAAIRSTSGSSKPIFVSTGHRVSLDSALEIVKLCCKYRIPEPVRQADIRSRDFLRKHHERDCNVSL